jgi:hypothetical protein
MPGLIISSFLTRSGSSEVESREQGIQKMMSLAGCVCVDWYIEMWSLLSLIILLAPFYLKDYGFYSIPRGPCSLQMIRNILWHPYFDKVQARTGRGIQEGRRVGHDGAG